MFILQACSRGKRAGPGSRQPASSESHRVLDGQVHLQGEQGSQNELVSRLQRAEAPEAHDSIHSIHIIYSMNSFFESSEPRFPAAPASQEIQATRLRELTVHRGFSVERARQAGAPEPFFVGTCVSGGSSGRPASAHD